MPATLQFDDSVCQSKSDTNALDLLIQTFEQSEHLLVVTQINRHVVIEHLTNHLVPFR